MFRYLLGTVILVVSTWPAFAVDPIAGRWSGYWISDTNGHKGPLRAVVRPTGAGYDVRFTGRFAGVVPFVYRSHFDTANAGDGATLVAERRLPLFGTFRTEATVTPNQFYANFQSGRDRGRFVLSR